MPMVPDCFLQGKKPVKTMEDLKGMKIRSHGTSAKVVKALGGTAVAMPMPELYQAPAERRCGRGHLSH